MKNFKLFVLLFKKTPQMLEKISIDMVDIRYISSIVMVLIASMSKQRSTKINTILAVLIIWVAYGARNTMLLLASIALNIGILWTSRMNEYKFTILNIIILYIYKIFGKLIEPRIKTTFDISGFLMILTVKMGYVAKDFDGNINNVLEYIFFIPGIVTGPTAPYDEFRKRNRMVDIPFPRHQFVKTIVFLMIYFITRSMSLINEVMSDDRTLASKLVYLYLFNIGNRCKFYFAWNFSHCCFILYNLPEYLNIDVYKVEFTESVKEISLNWNKFISLWLRKLFFDPFKSQSIYKAVALSHFVSAALHGINPCYLIFTFSFAMYRRTVLFANDILHYKILIRLQMILFVSYFSMPFYLLDVKELYRIWKSIYFIGHLYFTSWMVIYWGYSLIKTEKKIKKE